MAKTDWKMGDIVRPEDLNQLGREINGTSAAAATAQSIAENHASRHAAGGPDEITPAMIGAETPAGAQAKADAAEASAKAYTDTVAGQLTSAINAAQATANNHASRTDNPHGVTKAQVGLGNVQNYGIASQAQAEAGTDNASYMTPLRTKQYVDTRLLNNLKFRLNSGSLEYEDGGTWKTLRNMAVFKTNGTFTVPAGVNGIYITACGGGGGGASGRRDLELSRKVQFENTLILKPRY